MPSGSVTPPGGPDASPEPGALERVLALKALPEFAALDAADLVVLAGHARPCRFAEGERLHGGERPARELHLVLEGSVRVLRPGQPPRRAGARELVGSLDAFAGAASGASALAEEPTRTLAFDPEDLLEVCEEHHPVLLALLAGVARRAIAARRAAGPGAGFPPPDTRGGVAAGRRLGLGERIAFLRALPALAEARVHTLGELAQECEEVTFARGRVLWRAGDSPDAVFAVLRGAVDCRSADGAQRFAVGPGDLLGAMDVLGGTPLWHDAVARSEGGALRLERRALLDALEDDPSLAVDLLEVLARSHALLGGPA